MYEDCDVKDVDDVEMSTPDELQMLLSNPTSLLHRPQSISPKPKVGQSHRVRSYVTSECSYVHLW